MTVSEFQKEFERITPPAIAWKGDNVGLQIGRGNDVVTNVLVALDVTAEVVTEAVKKKANLIVTHHPLLFHPLKKISPASRVGSIVLQAIENKVNLYAAHTNLDSVRWGVNFSLARLFGLKNISILSPIQESLTKIAVFVPHEHCETVADAMHGMGAGMFSKYDHCSFRTEGMGTFRGMNGAKPFIGSIGKLEKTGETRLEMLCETWKVSSVINAMLAVHPYEEVAYDIYPLNNANTEFGLGAIGNLPSPMNETRFLNLISKKLSTPSLRFSHGKGAITKVAVCGGSGSELIAEAVAHSADAMVTADLKYHTFQEYEDRILLVDAGHFETEQVVLSPLAEQIGAIIHSGKQKSKVFITEKTTNPIRYH